MSASAAGLFRSTGNVRKAVRVMDLETGGISVLADGLEREKDDFYPTPSEPTLAFCAAERPYLTRFKGILEPAAGDGAMARDLTAGTGLPCELYDTVDRGCGADIRSFYDLTRLPADHAVVTNPPFKECHGDPHWCRHALETLQAPYLALLLPFTWPGSKAKAGFWHKWPPARVHLMRWRIDFTGQGAPPMLNAWFVWDDTHNGPTELHMLDRADARQGDMLAGVV